LFRGQIQKIGSTKRRAEELSGYISYRSANSELTVADIFRDYWADYREQYPVTAQQAKVVGSIMACRTPQLGGRVDCCQACGAWVFRFNSCRDRHCNQCQKYERARWVAKQKVLLLPIPWFHMIFTVDHALNPLIAQNQRLFYNLLFESVNQSLQRQAKAELGCELGITAVLHTWGQQIDAHYHLHCIVTGGGLALDRSRWVKLANPRYLLDVVALSANYRERLLGGLADLHRQGELIQWGEAAEVKVEEVIAAGRQKQWEVFAKPFETPEAVYEYLSRYVHQVALSNQRLEKVEDGQVTFRYFDNRERAEAGEKGPEKKLTLPVFEFIRRFLQHILPKGFVRIRYYGLHHSSARKEKLPRSRKLLGLEATLPEAEIPTLLEWLEELLGEEMGQCPHCGATGSMLERTRFTELPWLVGIILSLFGQPTEAGVCR
jgi:hypothetical protein